MVVRRRPPAPPCRSLRRYSHSPQQLSPVSSARTIVAPACSGRLRGAAGGRQECGVRSTGRGGPARGGGVYRRTLNKWWSWGKGLFLISEVPPYSTEPDRVENTRTLSGHVIDSGWALWWSLERGLFLVSEVPLYSAQPDQTGLTTPERSLRTQLKLFSLSLALSLAIALSLSHSLSLSLPLFLSLSLPLSLSRSRAAARASTSEARGERETTGYEPLAESPMRLGGRGRAAAGSLSRSLSLSLSLARSLTLVLSLSLSLSRARVLSLPRRPREGSTTETGKGYPAHARFWVETLESCSLRFQDAAVHRVGTSLSSATR